MVVVAFFAGGDEGSGLEWNTLLKAGGKCEKYQK